MYVPELKMKIISALRHEPLDHYQVAADLGEAPFRVRAELHDLRRDRIVREILDRRGHVWELTTRGVNIAYGADQLEIGA